MEKRNLPSPGTTTAGLMLGIPDCPGAGEMSLCSEDGPFWRLGEDPDLLRLFATESSFLSGESRLPRVPALELRDTAAEISGKFNFRNF